MPLYTADMITGYKPGSLTQPQKPKPQLSLPAKQKDEFLSGGFLSDVGDVLSVPQYAASGLYSGMGALKGIKTRETPSKILRKAGKIDDSLKGKVLGFGADVILDPLNLAAFAGLAGKAVGTLGKVAQATDIIQAGSKIQKASKFLEPLKFVETAGKGVAKLALGGEKYEEVAKALTSLRKPVTKIEPVLSKVDQTVKKIEVKQAVTESKSVLDNLIKAVESGDVATARTLAERLPSLETKTRALAIVDDFAKVAQEVGEAAIPKTGPMISGVPLLEAKTSGISSRMASDGSIVKTISDRVRKGQTVSPARVGEGFVMPNKEIVSRMSQIKKQAVRDIRLLYSDIKPQTVGKVVDTTADLIETGTELAPKTFKDKAMEKLYDISPMIARRFEKLDPQYLNRKHIMQGSISKGIIQAERLAKNVQTYARKFVESGPALTKPSAVKSETAALRRIWEIATGSKSVADNELPLRQAAALIRTNVDALSKDLASELKQIFPDQVDEVETILNNMGTYLPEYFLKFLNDKPAFANFIVGGDKATLDRLIKRKDLTDEMRQQLQAIRDGAFVGGKAVQDMTELVEKGRFFRWVAQNFGVTDQALQDASKFTKLPKDSRLGVLSGVTVPKLIGDDILGMQDVVTSTGLSASIQRLYKKALSLWKTGKVILNPAAQGRNFMSNTVLMDLAQYPIFSPKGIKTYGEAIGQVLKRTGKEYDEALKNGLLNTTQYSVELDRMLKNFGKTGVNPIKEFMQRTVSYAGDTYKTIEESSKLAVYMWRKSEGDSMVEAANYARKWLIDYSDIPEAVKWLRDMPFGFPFITFGYKAAGLTAETIAKRPQAVSKYYKLFRNIEDQSRKDEEFALPEYIKNGMYVRLPFSSETEMADGSIKTQPLYLDLNYILPWASVGDLTSGIGVRSNPAASITAALTMNKDPFTGYEIWNEATDTETDKLRKSINYIYRTIAPSFAPGTQPIEDLFGLNEVGLTGGYSWDKLYNAVAHKPDYKGRMRNMPITLSDVWLGIKAVPVDLEQGAVSRVEGFQQEKNKIRAEIKRTAKDQSLSPAQKAERIRELQQMLQEKSGEFSQDASTFRPRLIKPK